MASELVVTGLGVLSAIAQGRAAFVPALMEGRHAFGIMQRPGRQHDSAFLGAEIADIVFPDSIEPRTLRGASLSAQAALAVVCEAYDDAGLSEVESRRIGLIIGGSNLQQRELTQTHAAYRNRVAYLRPTYGLSFMDSDVCGLCTAQFGIRGIAYTVGGASASGQLAIAQGAQAVSAGQVDACIVVGALMDLSFWECQGLRALGAMGSDRYAGDPARACRPFDRSSDGFIFGESCGAVVVERLQTSERRGVKPYAALCGVGLAIDANRNPNPSAEGEAQAIQQALRSAGWAPADVEYVNTHGTGSPVGDQTELHALRTCGLSHAYLNATKSLIGHGLTAAGVVEVIATLLQMQVGQLHPTRNLEEPIDPTLNWVREQSIAQRVSHALTLSMGFGGINTALCWQSCQRQ